MLGIIHRATLGEGPDHFRRFLQNAPQAQGRTRSSHQKHDRQLTDARRTNFTEMYRRSILGLISGFTTVCNKRWSTLHLYLHANMVKTAAQAERADWAKLFSPRCPPFRHPLCSWR